MASRLQRRNKLLTDPNLFKGPQKSKAEMENTVKAYKKECERYKKLGGKDSFNEYGIRKGFLQVPSYQIPGFRGKNKYTSKEKENNEMIDKRIKWEDWKNSEV